MLTAVISVRGGRLTLWPKLAFGGISGNQVAIVIRWSSVCQKPILRVPLFEAGVTADIKARSRDGPRLKFLVWNLLYRYYRPT